jgi:hypothetical protein
LIREENRCTYQGKPDELVRKEIVVQAGRIRATAREELDDGLSLDAEIGAALDCTEHPFGLLGEQLRLRREMLQDGRCVVDRGQRGDVMNGGIVGEGSRLWRGQKSRVGGETHVDRGLFGGAKYDQRWMGVARTEDADEERRWESKEETAVKNLSDKSTVKLAQQRV